MRTLHVVKSTYSSETPVCNKKKHESLSPWHTTNKQTCLRAKGMKMYVEKEYSVMNSYSRLRLGHFYTMVKRPLCSWIDGWVARKGSMAPWRTERLHPRREAAQFPCRTARSPSTKLTTLSHSAQYSGHRTFILISLYSRSNTSFKNTRRDMYAVCT